MEFEIPERRQEELRATGETFYCPNGHTRAYKDNPKDKKIEALQSEVASLQRQLDEARAEVRYSMLYHCPVEGCRRRYKHRKRLVKHLKTQHHVAFPTLMLPATAGPDASGTGLPAN